MPTRYRIKRNLGRAIRKVLEEDEGETYDDADGTLIVFHFSLH